MRRKTIIRGLSNGQKIRVIVNGVNFTTTVTGMTEMGNTDQRIAVWNALEVISKEKITGYAGSTRVYDAKMAVTTVQFQVDLL